jgi:uncharacterized protein YbaR (Trm112 family)
MDLKDTIGIMICPKCQGKIKLHEMFIVCGKCRLAYPIIDSVPDMLVEDAWPLAKASKARFRHTLKL